MYLKSHLSLYFNTKLADHLLLKLNLMVDNLRGVDVTETDIKLEIFNLMVFVLKI